MNAMVGGRVLFKGREEWSHWRGVRKVEPRLLYHLLVHFHV